MSSAKWSPFCRGLYVLTHWGRDQIDTILQTAFSDVFSLITFFFILIDISLKFVPKGTIYNNPALV